MSDPANKTYAFGPFVLDARRRLLLREGRPVPLTPKALDLLVARGGARLDARLAGGAPRRLS